MKCLNCGASEGTLLKEFNPEKSYSYSELAEMTDACASCGSENIVLDDGFFHICMDCGKTVSGVNADGECADCVKETERLRNLK